MSDLYWLTDEQMVSPSPYFAKSHGKPQVDDRRVLSGIIFVNRNGLRWRDAPREYGPHKTLYNRGKRWGDVGIFARMMEGLSAQKVKPQTVMIEATYLKAHRTASSLGVKRGSRAPDRTHQRGDEHQASSRDRCQWTPAQLLYHSGPDQRLHRRGRFARGSAQGKVDARRPGLGCVGAKGHQTCAFQAANPAHSLSNTTSPNTSAATASRSCSAASRTGAAWQRDTIAVQLSSSPLSLWPQPCSSGSDQRDLTLDT